MKFNTTCSRRASKAKFWQSKLCRYVVIILITGVTLSCGGSSDSTLPTGPDLDISELSSLKIDQLKFTGGVDDDNDKIPEAAIYLRCKESGLYAACAGQEQGLNIIKKSGLSYGGLDIPLTAVEGASGNCLDVEVVFVEKDSADCPKTVTSDDDIVGVSDAVTIDENGKGNLVGSKIISTDETNFIRFIAGDVALADDLDPSPQITENILTLDQLYFTRPSVDGKDASYKLVVKDIINTEGLRCEAAFDETSGIIKEKLIHGGLGIQLLDTSGNPCEVTVSNKNTKINITLTILTDNGTSAENLMTDPEEEHTLADLVDGDGMREKFADDAGFVRFMHI